MDIQLHASQPMSVAAFLDRLPAAQREDCVKLCQLMMEVTGEEPVLWGPSIVGFGQKDGQERPDCSCDGLEIGFAPRNGKILLYLRRYANHYEHILKQMEGIEPGRACMTLRSLSDIDLATLRHLLEYAWQDCTRG